jgi:hypothetical protein
MSKQFYNTTPQGGTYQGESKQTQKDIVCQGGNRFCIGGRDATGIARRDVVEDPQECCHWSGRARREGYFGGRSGRIGLTYSTCVVNGLTWVPAVSNSTESRVPLLGGGEGPKGKANWHLREEYVTGSRWADTWDSRVGEVSADSTIGLREAN